MTGPSSREESVLGLVVDGLREVKESIAVLSRDMSSKMAVLVSQREFDRTRDDLTIDIGEVRAKIDTGLIRHDADIESVRKAAEASVNALKDALEAAEQRRRTERWAAVGAFLTVVGLSLTVILHYV